MIQDYQDEIVVFQNGSLKGDWIQNGYDVDSTGVPALMVIAQIYPLEWKMTLSRVMTLCISIKV